MMTFVRKSYEEITESILSQITKGVVNERHEYRSTKVKYPLNNPEAKEIVRIDGTVNTGPGTFARGTDYRLSGNAVEWLRDGTRPDENTPFFVNYRLDTAQGITDINPGSVVRTIVEAVSREMDFVNAQMNQVYNSAFIDTATGKSLDLVSSLLGISRKTAGYASGDVTFGRDSDPGETEVLRETHLFRANDRYLLKNPQVKAIKKIEGTCKGAPLVFAPGKDYTVTRGEVTWVPQGRQPDEGSVFSADYSAFQLITIPLDTRVSTYSRRPETVKVFRTTREVSFTKNAAGKWEAVVPVSALKAGKEGNVFAGMLTVMPRPAIGVEYVINTKDILNGTDPETDTELRERARHALETAGKGTLASLRSAVKSIDGISGEVKVVDQADGIPGIVQVIASGGDEKEIRRVIEETRSAGIRVEFKRPAIVPLDVRLTIVVTEDMDRDAVRTGVDGTIRKYLGTLNIDDDVIRSQIIRRALNIPGIRDVRDVTVNDKKENIEISTDQKGELRILEIFVEE
ncbi:MAG: baseplate J/gp47 family protein [Methanoregula sp.]|nr:baseplate J/gp47 family protein [Methanoregula sp.]